MQHFIKLPSRHNISIKVLDMQLTHDYKGYKRNSISYSKNVRGAQHCAEYSTVLGYCEIIWSETLPS